jgi:hypothetical protein
MKRAFIILGVALSTAGSAIARADGSFEVKGQIAGQNLKSILTALPELDRWHLKPDRYLIEVIADENGQTVVSFSDPDRPAGLRGGSPNMTELEVHLSPDGTRVISTNYVR